MGVNDSSLLKQIEFLDVTQTQSTTKRLDGVALSLLSCLKQTLHCSSNFTLKQTRNTVLIPDRTLQEVDQ